MEIEHPTRGVSQSSHPGKRPASAPPQSSALIEFSSAPFCKAPPPSENKDDSARLRLRRRHCDLPVGSRRRSRRGFLELSNSHRPNLKSGRGPSGFQLVTGLVSCCPGGTGRGLVWNAPPPKNKKTGRIDVVEKKEKKISP